MNICIYGPVDKGGTGTGGGIRKLTALSPTHTYVYSRPCESPKVFLFLPSSSYFHPSAIHPRIFCLCFFTSVSLVVCLTRFVIRVSLTTFFVSALITFFYHSNLLLILLHHHPFVRSSVRSSYLSNRARCMLSMIFRYLQYCSPVQHKLPIAQR